ncbi:MAG: 16S rRNA (cytidine(1402)-2'-O)-methyltransferase [Gluconacetobacter diazotrophicus]|nr:16S rRNA (cytidine(1402)-2'-O)-methyltransferase [Gluconacetobacter diazotrophicus]
MSDDPASLPPRSDVPDDLAQDAEPRDAAGSPGSEAQLVLVSTPIGNLGDITERAVRCLREADLILCEDTRTTRILLRAKGIPTRTEALHEHNEKERVPALLDDMRRGRRLALVSDAGTPLLSDPGYRLVTAAIEAGLRVSAAPGASAVLTALTLSGLPPQPFLFLGFPPPRPAARSQNFGSLRAAERAGLSATLVWHEAPHRLREMLADLLAVFGDRNAVVARELTKRFEEVRRDRLAALAEHYAHHDARGEITVLLAPQPPESDDREELDRRLQQALATLSVKDAAALVAGALSLPRRLVYARAMELAGRTRAVE